MKTEMHRDEVPRKPRTNMLVMATISAGSGSAPVKIRDLSPDGALIEGGVLPHSGSTITLVRGDLAISGRVVWTQGGRAGLRFDALANVADWLPNAKTSQPQARIDAAVNEFRNAGETAPISFTEPPSSRVNAEEILRVKAMLGSLAEQLADDADVVSRHGSKLQALDLATQLLAKLAMETP